MANPDQIFGDKTYAQHGDDIVIACIFERLGIMLPTYLDVGAHDPVELSNTALFYERGSHGVNVEANPALMDKIREHRTRDVNINCGVGPTSGSMSLYRISPTSGCNSFLRSNAERYGTITDEVSVSVLTLNEIVEKYCSGVFPDLLSLDVEGLDYMVLAAADFSRAWPKVICVEAIAGWEFANPIRELLESKGYFFCIRACNNAMFVRNEYRSRMY